MAGIVAGKEIELLRIAHELSRDIEDLGIPTGNVVNKARRLAVLMPSAPWEVFFRAEALGYDNLGELGPFAILVHRWDGTSDTFVGIPASTLEENNRLWERQIDTHEAFKPEGQWALVHHQDRVSKIAALHGQISANQKRLTAIRAMAYHFATMIINERQFVLAAGDIFKMYQEEVERRLVETAQEAFAKMPHCFERLQQGSVEAVSHALTSCRRIIDAFADAVFPPQAEAVRVGEDLLDCGPDKSRNRLRVFIHRNIESKSRRDRLRRAVSDLYDRTSTGVHNEVSLREAQALVLQTYSLLGELALLQGTEIDPFRS